jgi:hypothetical protein
VVQKYTYKWALMTLLEDPLPERSPRGAALIGAPGKPSVVLGVDEDALQELASRIPKYPPITMILVDTPGDIHAAARDVLGEMHIYKVSYRIDRRKAG